MPMLLNAASNDLAFERIEGGKDSGWYRCAYSRGHGGGAPLFHGRPGSVRSSAWI